MGSLRDSSDFGARPAEQHFYGNIRVGRGRWSRLPMGVLWTDDDDALQLSRLPGVDQAAAYDLRVRLHGYAAANAPATQVFDRIVAEYATAVVVGDLADVPAS
ncbi:hypothetical protein [Rhodococcoides fascians]|uniref:hypothetical protein n=1 Tax=Rhodococcoides fascians TaxID=1828 RepID=UPI00050C012E|nr:hypothetical protein [Rhodococcus fascians]